MREETVREETVRERGERERKRERERRRKREKREEREREERREREREERERESEKRAPMYSLAFVEVHKLKGQKFSVGLGRKKKVDRQISLRSKNLEERARDEPEVPMKWSSRYARNNTCSGGRRKFFNPENVH